MSETSDVRFALLNGVRRLALGAVLTAAVAGLSACYVVPIDHRASPPPVAVPAPAPGPVLLTARLYPANDLAARHGVVNAHVTNDLQGRGTFAAVIGAESFAGEATRRANSARDGMASGAGNRGGYLSCQYTMNSATQGTGRCRLHDGAEFTMHLGQ
jgi:hypothetical protein